MGRRPRDGDAGTTRTACRTSSGWRHCLAAALDDQFRGRFGPLVLERGPATQPAVRRVLRGRAAGRLPADRRRQRLPAGGLRAVRPQHPPRASTVGGAGLPASGDEPAEPRRPTRAFVDADPVRGQPGRSAWSTRTAAADAQRVTAGEVILCGGAINSPQLLQLSGRGRRRRAAERSGIDVVHDLPGVGEHLQDHLEVYVQYACKQPVSMAAVPAVAAPAVDRLRSGSFLRQRPGRDEPLRGRRLRPQQRRRRLPEPDVPLPADGRALRRLGAGERPRLPGPHRPDVLGRARLGEDQAATRACTRRCASTTSRPSRTGASGSRRSAWRAAS